MGPYSAASLLGAKSSVGAPHQNFVEIEGPAKNSSSNAPSSFPFEVPSFPSRLGPLLGIGILMLQTVDDGPGYHSPCQEMAANVIGYYYFCWRWDTAGNEQNRSMRAASG